MNLIFTPNHVQLLNSCYPPASSLLTAGPDYSPNSQELSRLTYYASNHPGKLTKLGSELEKRLRVECRKARSGNIRTRASLLITLAIFRALATECRRDIALLSPSLVASVDAALSSVPSDLEVIARAASVFTAWTTYTNGQLIGADSNFTRDYLSALRGFATLSCSQAKDPEIQNRMRLVGFAALTGALSSEALYNDSLQFRSQVSIIMRPILVTMFQTGLKVLDDQAEGVKRAPLSPYLSEFRTRPIIERRAASIHLHIDGDKGPSISDVSSACLRAFVTLLEHANGLQLGYIMRSSFDNLDDMKGWTNLQHCCWFAQKTADWSQYQYRYAVPTWLVERLLQGQDEPVTSSMHKALTFMVTTVFNSPTPLINLSTSDILSNLMTMVVRRTSLDPEDSLLPDLVRCISSLGTHVYYSDQIQDLAVELINRLTLIEMQGVVVRGGSSSGQVRTEVIRELLAGLSGLVHSADIHESSGNAESRKRPESVSAKTSSPSIDATNKDAGVDERASRRTRVSSDIWHDTLSLLCDKEYAVRVDYAQTLVFYLANEMPKHPDLADADGPHRLQTVSKHVLLYSGDIGAKFLNALHAYIYILATAASLGLTSSPSISYSASVNGHDHAARSAEHHVDHDPIGESLIPDPSFSASQTPRSRKISLAFRLLERASSQVTSADSACLSDYTHILDVLTTVHAQLPVRGLLTGLPMLLALDGATCKDNVGDPATVRRINTMKAVLAKLWLLLGSQWDCRQLVDVAEKALTNVPKLSKLPTNQPWDIGTYHSAPQSVHFSSEDVSSDELAWSGVDAETALSLIVANRNVQEATGLDSQSLLRRFSVKWTAEGALKDSYKKSTPYDNTIRGDGISPLLKISPGFMHIENMSLQSLARSTRGVGVTELREALEGRSSMSNPALALGGRPSSISTLDHGSSVGDSRLTKTRSRTKKRTITSGTGEVRDVLNRLGIGKQNGSLLKASFPTLQKDPARVSGRG
ncbi:uncharacterized protein BT62DRAFT_985448 [Guyanagaster necrorhizus]|uniref:Protein EFR3 n=1 Tax=Guyanagaster necrorhizus TaxID=856835 RepID=A0A9P8AV11_9AGAR|nr:uncharacterized protein BT62DRAFT_985448 [Guyanagaster necrorhizus MCA 3950]KAG7449059.1 hypothetical protein BT62DRAFT_985448 [Guyanagaster necrorhizus MCA 3950]